MRSARLGQMVFAVTMVGLGILGLIEGDLPSLWLPLPHYALPARPALGYLCALVSLASGLGVFWKRTAAAAARLLFVWLLGWQLVVRVPNIGASPKLLVFWSWASTMTLLAAAWVLLVWSHRDGDRQRFGWVTGDNGLRVARALYGLALIPFGLAHFVYLKETVVLVPPWPPSAVFWAYFTGAGLVAAGAAVLVRVWARLAAVLSTLELAGFTLIVWVPIVATGHANAGQWSEFVVSWVLTVAAWVVADSYCGVPWLAVGKP